MYTSHAGEGLRKGTGGGFCTVLSTQGMAINLATSLEKLSGYKHPFDINDPRSNSNPVNYRHAVMRIGGSTLHVLSRIADHRFEHTGRSNKLAHHIALSKQDLPPCGPAILCQHPGFFRADWDGNVRLEVPREVPAPGDFQQIKPCDAWQRAAGDAGWAGVVAEHVLNDPNKTISVIFPLNTNTLELMAEAMSLMPLISRWNTTFSTFFTTLPAGTSCSVRFLLADTPESDRLLRDHREVVINLASSLGSASGDKLVEAARTGVLRHSRLTVDSPRRVPLRPVASPPRSETGPPMLEQSDELVLAPPTPSTRSKTAYPPATTTSPQETTAPKSKVVMLSAVIAALAAVLLLFVATASYFLYEAIANTPKPSNAIASHTQNAEVVVRTATVEKDHPPALDAPGQLNSQPSTEAPEAKTEPETGNDSHSEQVANGLNPPDLPPVANVGETARKTFQQHPNQNQVIPDARNTRPAPAAANVEKSQPNVKFPDIFELPELSDAVTNPSSEYPYPTTAKVEIVSVIFDAAVKGSNADFFKTSDGCSLTQSTPTDVNLLGAQITPIASLSLTDHTIGFNWHVADITANLNTEQQSLAAGLRWCWLHLNVNGKDRFCRLSKPRQVQSLALEQPPVLLSQYLQTASPSLQYLSLDKSFKLASSLEMNEAECDGAHVTRNYSIKMPAPELPRIIYAQQISLAETPAGVTLDVTRKMSWLRDGSNFEFASGDDLTAENLKAAKSELKHVRERLTRMIDKAKEVKYGFPSNADPEPPQVTAANMEIERLKNILPVCEKLEEVYKSLDAELEQPLTIVEGKILVDYKGFLPPGRNDTKFAILEIHQ